MSGAKLKMIMVLQLACLVMALGYGFSDVGTPFLLRFSVVFMFIFIMNWVLTSGLKEISSRLDKLEGSGKSSD